MVSTTRKTPFYDDVEVGSTLPSFEVLMTIPIFFRWCAAVETARRDHYDAKYAMEKQDLPGAVLSGAFSQAFIWGKIFKWAGPQGWVLKTSQKNAASVYPGDIIEFYGTVVNKYVKDGLGYLDLDVGLRRKQDGTVPVPGSATVVLPIKGGRKVPYPFKP